MFVQMHFAVAAAGIAIGVVSLLWTLACAITANRMEREGLTFWKGFVTCLLLTPLIGLLAIGVTHFMRPSRPLVQTVSRG